tara:strand:+ start:648 stop:896 length:249 start_codon:yes stop_codon:yes gene_type:complete
MIELENSTTTSSKDGCVTTQRLEFNDDTEYVTVSLHCDELKVKQETNTHSRSYGTPFKVKTFEAYDEKGNRLTLKIFFGGGK